MRKYKCSNLTVKINFRVQVKIAPQQQNLDCNYSTGLLSRIETDILCLALIFLYSRLIKKIIFWFAIDKKFRAALLSYFSYKYYRLYGYIYPTQIRRKNLQRQVEMAIVGMKGFFVAPFCARYDDACDRGSTSPSTTPDSITQGRCGHQCTGICCRYLFVHDSLWLFELRRALSFISSTHP